MSSIYCKSQHSIRYSKSWIKLYPPSIPFWICFGTYPHTIWAEGQLQWVCWTISSSLVQIGQRALGIAPRLNRFFLVGRRSLQALHINILLALRILRFQNKFSSPFRNLPLRRMACRSFFHMIRIANWKFFTWCPMPNEGILYRHRT
jgi:hypothetical protein